MYKILPLPIYITENGTCDKNDSFRSLYIYEHIKALTESELPFRCYCHWCFTDNFEWLEGESARFGLVHIDYETAERQVKTSGEFLSTLRKRRGVDEAMIAKYLQAQRYKIAQDPKYTDAANVLEHSQEQEMAMAQMQQQVQKYE